MFPGSGAPALSGVRVDGWIETGLEVSPYYDPMLAKVIATGETREDALDLLREGLEASRVDGVVTNLGPAALADRRDTALRAATHSTSTLDVTADPDPRIEVIEAGAMTTVQDMPGRVGYWQVGVPPSGPMDAVSLSEANLAVGNPAGAPGLEITATGPDPALQRAGAGRAGRRAGIPATLDGGRSAMWEPIEIRPARRWSSGTMPGPGLRTYLAVRGGIDVPLYLGSASTFTLGGFGGHAGRALAARRRAAARLARLRCAASGSPRGHPGSARSAARPRRAPARAHRRLAGRRDRGAARRARILHPRATWTSSTPPTTRSTTTRPAPACA